MDEVEGHEARVCTGAKQLKLDSNKIKRLIYLKV